MAACKGSDFSDYRRNESKIFDDAAGAALFGQPDTHPLYGVPTLVLVSSKKPDPLRENVAFSNAAILAHNMALAATDLGVGSCYIWGAIAALSGSAELLKELNLPEGFIPCCAIGLGKTDCKYEIRDIPENRIAKSIIE